MYIPHIRQFDPIDIEAMSCLRLSWVRTSFNRDVSEASCFFIQILCRHCYYTCVSLTVDKTRPKVSTGTYCLNYVKRGNSCVPNSMIMSPNENIKRLPRSTNNEWSSSL